MYSAVQMSLLEVVCILLRPGTSGPRRGASFMQALRETEYTSA